MRDCRGKNCSYSGLMLLISFSIMYIRYVSNCCWYVYVYIFLHAEMLCVYIYIHIYMCRYVQLYILFESFGTVGSGSCFVASSMISVLSYSR